MSSRVWHPVVFYIAERSLYGYSLKNFKPQQLHLLPKSYEQRRRFALSTYSISLYSQNMKNTHPNTPTATAASLSALSWSISRSASGRIVAVFLGWRSFCTAATHQKHHAHSGPSNTYSPVIRSILHRNVSCCYVLGLLISYMIVIILTYILFSLKGNKGHILYNGIFNYH